MKNNLKELREQANLSQQQLGERCGLSRLSIYKYERIDGYNPGISNAYAVAKVLGKTVYEIWPDTTEIEEEQSS